ncbi:transaldolase [Novimethylophilus kurashikiensis]|uniref:Transaldolase n=1 Tax=Novimethylophilus kurashikiensis TaxID=1825523 RepID=A0A2R5F8N0_9PROT|nr:hypothetical protein [Novimethylophilus kurashikiensis]GBG14602.1 transaldolase [Novimethylophilus kurashikiensis]
MDLETYRKYWHAVSPRMLELMAALHAALADILPDEGLSITKPILMTNADEWSVSMDIKQNSSDASILGLDFKLLDGDIQDGDGGCGIALTLTGYTGLLMGGYYPGNYTPEAFTDDEAVLLERVEGLPLDRFPELVRSALKNPVLLNTLKEDGINLH